ncbi:MAG: hydrogenase formation protein HypD [Desulfitobacteriia bacterium]|jgi:hydrogenase expression/formation protein HypD
MNLEKIIRDLKEYSGPPLNIMEVCGTHTASIFKNGIKSLLSSGIRLISGPGCPVCITPAAYIDRAVELALKPNHTLLTFGDMMKVPGGNSSLSDAKAQGGKVEIIYSPQEALKKAKQNPATTYVLACVGFETTTPSYAILVEQIHKQEITNIKLLTALRRVLPALDYICAGENEISAFLAPGHVSAVLGSKAYENLARKYNKPFAVAGFEGEHILLAIYDLVKQVEQNKNEVHNLYPSIVREKGNPKALAYIDNYFEPGPAYWRGIGSLEESGLYLKKEFREYDAGSFALADPTQEKPNPCRCGEVIQGRINPDECPLFTKTCTPSKPLGPCMVSPEGTCGIWYRFHS